MSFKIGFVQRHWVAFQVTGAMRWHDVTLVRPGIKGSTLMMRSFVCGAKSRWQSEHACSLIQPCLMPPCYLWILGKKKKVLRLHTLKYTCYLVYEKLTRMTNSPHITLPLLILNAEIFKVRFALLTWKRVNSSKSRRRNNLTVQVTDRHVRWKL